jgi:hypothetical protein
MKASVTVALSLVATTLGAAPLTFDAAFPKTEGGAARSVAFTGSLDNGRVTGQVSVDGEQFVVAATLEKGTVSGTFDSGARRLGTFSAKRVGTDLEGTHDLNGEIGRWRIPLSEIPAAARAVLQ